MQLLHAWWTDVGVGMLTSSHPMVYLAGIQLYYSFNIHSAYTGPWCSKKKWYSNELEVPVSAQLPWGSRTGLFMRMLRCYLKSNKLVLPTKMARPAATSVGRWVVCLKMRWSQLMLDQIDQLILDKLGRQLSAPADFAVLTAAKTS